MHTDTIGTIYQHAALIRTVLLQACANILKRKPAVLEALKHPKPSRHRADLPTFMTQIWLQVSMFGQAACYKYHRCLRSCKQPAAQAVRLHADQAPAALCSAQCHLASDAAGASAAARGLAGAVWYVTDAVSGACKIVTYVWCEAPSNDV